MEKSEDIKDYIFQNKLNELIEYDHDWMNVLNKHKTNLFAAVDPKNITPFPVDWGDLIQLHKLIRSRKVLTILEFGTGFSSLIMADALYKNKIQYSDFVREKIRRQHAFELHVVEASCDWVEIAKSRIPQHLQEILKFTVSKVEMSTYNSQICTLYKSMPLINPDFIYVDGPDQYDVAGDVRGISTRDSDFVPMSGDLLQIEPFLLPGTLVRFDGRVLNARFFKNNAKRIWISNYDEAQDATTFTLSEPPIGKKNAAQLKWQLSDEV